MTEDHVRTTQPRRVRRVAAMSAMVSAAAMLLVAPAEAGTATPGAPGVPEVTRVSAGPYAGFQLCGGPQLPVVSTGWSPTFAASARRSEGAPSLPGTVHPDTYGQFEIALPGSEGSPFVRESSRVGAGGQLIMQKSVPAGTYRWRVRAEQHSLVSPWTAWCDFTVTTSTP